MGGGGSDDGRNADGAWLVGVAMVGETLMPHGWLAGSDGGGRPKSGLPAVKVVR